MYRVWTKLNASPPLDPIKTSNGHDSHELRPGLHIERVNEQM